jgi:HSP20 family protein
MRIIRYYPNNRSLVPAHSPWSGLEQEIDSLFSTAVTGLGGAVLSRTQFPVDLYEDQANAYVRAELPGMKREDIQVETADGVLSITTARQKNGEDGCAFSRSVTLPQDVQSEQVTAAYENGVLTVTLPKRPETKPKKVAVTVQ